MTNPHTFGFWQFDADSGDLHSLDPATSTRSTQRLEPQIAKVLAYFLANQDRVISREELIEKVWNQRLVGDDAINRSISKLRQVLTPDDRSAFIETVPRRGYRSHFPPGNPMADSVQEDEMSPVRGNSDASSLIGKRRVMDPALPALVTAILLLIFGYHSNLNENTEESGVAAILDDATPSIAVLPFTNLSRDEEAKLLGDGISETVIHLLSQVKGIKVIARTSSFAFRNKEMGVDEIAKALDVNSILEGSVQLSAEKVRIVARLINVNTGSEVWSRVFEEALSDTFAIQDDIAREVVVSLNSELLTNKEHLQPRYRPVPAAYEALLRGRENHNKSTSTGRANAIRYYKEAIAIDPGYAEPYAALAKTYISQAPIDASAREKARAEVKKQVDIALNLDPLLVDAHLLLARNAIETRDFETAKIILERILKIAPGSAEAMSMYAMWHYLQSDYDGAVPLARQSVSLDPYKGLYQSVLAIILWANGKAEESIAIVKELIQRDPDIPANYAYLSRWTLQMGNPGKALYYAQKELEADPESLGGQRRFCDMQYQLWDKTGARQCYLDHLEQYPDDFDGKLALPLIDGDCNKAAELLKNKQVNKGPTWLYRKGQFATALSCVENWQQVVKILGEIPGLNPAGPIKITDNTLLATRRLGQALQKTNRHEEAEVILNTALAHINRSRKMQTTGFTSGIEDVHILTLLGRSDEALDRLQSAVEAGWAYQSVDFQNDPNLESLKGNIRLGQLVEKMRQRMENELVLYEAFNHRQPDPLLDR